MTLPNEEPRGSGAGPLLRAVWKAVCSGYRKDLAPREKRAMRLDNSRTGTILGKALARAAGIASPTVGWRMVHDPTYDNQVGTLELEPNRAALRIETTAESDWRDPELAAVFEQRLL